MWNTELHIQFDCQRLNELWAQN